MEEIRMGKLKGLLSAVAISALGATGAGCWDDDDDDIVQVDGVYAEIDTNNDGVVTVTEWNAAFPVWDVNDDGYIAASEYRLSEGFATLDVDANGLLTAAEWDAGFPLWDVDDDGYLYPSELFF
jgi:hypothetical protein